MISRITGRLEQIDTGSVTLAPPEAAPAGIGLAYDVLVPGFVTARLGGSIGRAVTLHTLHFLESHNQGSSFRPRLAGFLSPEDRAFFEVFTEVKGIGYRKALRAMTLDTATLAAAIADRDTKLLQTLPEVGKRTAETIIVTLKDRVDAFLAQPRVGGEREMDVDMAAVRPRGIAGEALDVLVQLGENRADALRWIEHVLGEEDPPNDTEALVAAVFARRGG